MMKRLLTSSTSVASHSWRRQAVCSSQTLARRSFASRRKMPQKKKNTTSSPPKPKRKLPPGVYSPQEADSVPPAYLSPTASPFVYVATCAMQEANMDPKSLFSQDEAIPHFQAHYISPKDFGHELPSYNIPQVAFLGRSNVGKSSLVNALLRSKDLAKCSKQPGRTQQVNYYGMYRSNCQNMIPSNAVGYFIDLPGYGFAKAPPDAVRKWQEATQEFLINRRDANVLTRLFVLVDARRGATQIDRDIMGWFDEAGIAYSVVLTKADRVSRAQIVRFVNEVCMRYHAQVYGEDGSQGPIVHVTSARDGQGISELLTSINAEFIGYREALSMMRQGGDEGWTSGEQDEVNEDGNDFVEEPEDISR